MLGRIRPIYRLEQAQLTYLLVQVCIMRLTLRSELALSCVVNQILHYSAMAIVHPAVNNIVFSVVSGMTVSVGTHPNSDL